MAHRAARNRPVRLPNTFFRCNFRARFYVISVSTGTSLAYKSCKTCRTIEVADVSDTAKDLFPEKKHIFPEKFAGDQLDGWRPSFACPQP
jgi:hypothetical protein